jgi:tRNA pseudouridine55 synthase
MDDLVNATQPFKGEIMQVPPAHSAIKKEGVPVYKMARKGIEVKLEPRKLTIYEFEIVRYEAPLVYFRVVCSTGTYIRSLANDFGATLGCGAHLSSLRRTRIGEFSVDDAMLITDFEKHIAELKGEV